jgi:hypothetical protein
MMGYKRTLSLNLRYFRRARGYQQECRQQECRQNFASKQNPLKKVVRTEQGRPPLWASRCLRRAWMQRQLQALGWQQEELLQKVPCSTDQPSLSPGQANITG